MTQHLQRRDDFVIPVPSEQTVSAVTGDTYDVTKTLNVIGMFAGTGSLSAATVSLVNAIFSSDRVDAKMRELMIVRTAKVLNCTYALQIGTIIARNNSLTAEEVDAAVGEKPVAGLRPEYVLICRMVDELTTRGTLDDATLHELKGGYDAMACRQIILMICWFNLVNRFENGCRVPFESPAKIASMISPTAS